MSYEDRIVEAIYTSPSGKDFRFKYENLQKEIVKKTTAFNFPDVEGTYIQDLGKSGRRYPMRVIFWGADYDKTADEFDAAIEEKGAGRLRHPFYGEFDVVPMGTIKRRDDLVTAANQAIYDITFWETIDIVFPTSVVNVQNSIEDGLFAYEVAQSENFGDSISAETPSEQLGLIDSAKAAIRKVKREMAAIANATDEISRDFNNLFDIIDDSIDILIGTPTLLAGQLIQLSKLPARSQSSIGAKLESYRSLIDSFVSGPSNQFQPGNDSENDNSFTVNNLMASVAVTASIESTISEFSVYSTRTQIIAAIERLIDSFNSYVDWSDDNRERLIQGVLPTKEPGTNDLIDTGEGYQNLQDIFSLAAGRLTEIVFTALQERSVRLTRDRSLLDFAAEFYGEIDTELDFIIESNNLSGSEILGLSKGREMLYYV